MNLKEMSIEELNKVIADGKEAAVLLREKKEEERRLKEEALEKEKNKRYKELDDERKKFIKMCNEYIKDYGKVSFFDTRDSIFKYIW